MLQIMHSMENEDEEKLDSPRPIACAKPDFPYGLRITLTHKEFDKLELNWKDAVVGGLVHGHFLARITSVSSDNDGEEERGRVELQIENLAIESEDEEDEDE